MSLQSDIEDYAKQNPSLQSVLDEFSKAIDQFTIAFDQLVEQIQTSAENYWEQIKNDTDGDHDDADTDAGGSINDTDVKVVAKGETAVYEDVVTDAKNFGGGPIENGLKATFSGNTANLELNNVGVYGTDAPDFSNFDSSFAITLDEAESANVDTLNIVSLNDNDANQIFDVTTDLLFDVTNGDVEGLQSLETININLASGANANVLFDGESLSDVTTIDASESQSELNLALPSLEKNDSALESVTLGKRNDQFTLRADRLTADSLDIEVGQGDDVVTLMLGEPVGDSATPTAITLIGNGDDNTYRFQGGNITQEDVDDNVLTNTVTVTAFSSGSDKLQLEGFNGLADQPTVDDVLNTQDTLYNNVVDVASVIDEGSTAWFIFKDSYYYYQDTNAGGDNGANFSAGGTLIELPGVDFNQGFSATDGIMEF